MTDTKIMDMPDEMGGTRIYQDEKIKTEKNIKLAQDFVLALFLSDYDEGLTYDQVLTMMTEEPDWESEISVWQPFEHYTGDWMAKTIHETMLNLVRTITNA